MCTLRFCLLGPFQVIRKEQPLAGGAWRSQQVRTILKLLLVRRGSVVTSDQLIDLLWPDEDPAAARRHLHVRISQLRRALDADRPSAYVTTAAGGYTLNPEARCWIDAAAFEALASEGRSALEAGDLERATAVLEQAREHYRGDLLGEDLYQDWCYGERERLRELYLTVLTETAEAYALRGRYRPAIARCRETLVKDPCREATHVRLMLYHYYAGERAQALRAYERCRQVLWDELGVEPLPETESLAEQIRQGQVLAGEGRSRYPPPVYDGRLYRVPYSLGHAPLVGREREYAWLSERRRSLGAGLILIEGEAGVGKSRLADEFLGYLDGLGVEVLRSRATSGDDLPYAPVVRALEPLWARGEAEGLAPATLAVLATLFPKTHPGTVGLPSLPEVAPAQERERLIAALETWLRTCLPSGAVVYIDDAHRADRGTVALLARLARHLTVVVTARSEETPAGHPLRGMLRQSRHEGRGAQLALEPLPEPAVRDLLRQMAGAEMPELGEWLAVESGGNPLFVVATLQHLFEEGALYVDAERRWAATGERPAARPASVCEVIEQRLAALSHEGRRLFDLAAVAGSGLSYGLLQEASGMADAPLLDAVDSLLEAGLLEEPRTASRDELTLAHARYGEVDYAALPELRRRQLHLRVAEALIVAAADADASAPAVARHLERGGDALRAATWLVRAGDAAVARYAHEEALAYYERAVALKCEDRAQVWEKMGRIAHHLARYAGGVRYYESALAWRQRRGEQAQWVQTQLDLAECYRELSRFGEAVEHAQAGLNTAMLLPGQAAAAARAHIILSNALRSGQLAGSGVVREHLLQALALVRPLVSPDGAVLSPDREGENLSPEATRAWQLLGEATFWLGVVTVNGGDAPAALGYDREALACFRRTRQAGWEAMACNNTGYHALLAGQGELALGMAERGLALAREIGSLNAQGWLLSTLGEVQTHLGRLETARGTLEEGLAHVTRWGPPRLRPGFLADLARVAIEERGWHGALARLAEALAVAGQSAPQFVPRLKTYHAETLLGQGDPVGAIQAAEEALAGAQRKGQRSVEGRAWRLLGAAQAASGRREAALASLARSLEVLEATGDRLEAARTQSVWGRLLLGWGQAEGRERLAAARRTFADCQATLDLRRMEEI